MNINKNYCLIVFIEDSTTKSIDIVPSCWLSLDFETNVVLCPFISTFSKANRQNLDKCVKELSQAPSTWTKYAVEVRGYADTYDEGLTKLKKLEAELHTFTTDCTDDELHIEQKQDELRKRLKGVKQLKDVAKPSRNPMEELLNSKVNLKKKIEDTCSSGRSSGLTNPDDTLNNIISSEESDCESRDRSFQNNDRTNKIQKQEHSSVDKFMEMNNNCLAEIKELKTFFVQRFNKLTQQLGSIQGEIIQLKLELMNLAKTPAHKTTAPSRSDLILPFTTKEDFQEFDKKLELDAQLREYVIDIIWPLVNTKERLFNTLKPIMRRFLIKDILQLYTALRKVDDKDILKDTNFCNCVYEVVQSEFKKNTNYFIKEKEFYAALGSVINYSKDWDGGYQLRKEAAASKKRIEGYFIYI